jgi:AraC-like DNA-binding protein
MTATPGEHGTASIVALRPMLSFARSRGVDVDDLLRRMNVPGAALDDYDLRISEADRLLAWTEVPRLADHDHFGLEAALQAPVGAYDVLDYAMKFSSTVEDALDRIQRFHRVLCDAWGLHRFIADGVVHLWPQVTTPRHEIEHALAILVLRARQHSARDVVPLEVRFSHAAPGDLGPYASIFRCTVRFECARTELLFPAKDLEAPFRSAEPGVNRILDRYMGEIVAQLPKGGSFLERARVEVADQLIAGRTSLASLAERFHASPRTVQRRLAEGGTTHHALVESVRRDAADKMLRDGSRSITEIAFLLGFADVGSFRRAYKRWTGGPPSRARPRPAPRRNKAQDGADETGRSRA